MNKHDCHEVGYRNDAEIEITGIIPSVTFADGTTHPSQGRRLLAYSCASHQEDTVAYFAKLGHQEVRFSLVRRVRANG